MEKSYYSTDAGGVGFLLSYRVGLQFGTVLRSKVVPVSLVGKHLCFRSPFLEVKIVKLFRAEDMREILLK